MILVSTYANLPQDAQIFCVLVAAYRPWIGAPEVPSIVDFFTTRKAAEFYASKTPAKSTIFTIKKSQYNPVLQTIEQ